MNVYLMVLFGWFALSIVVTSFLARLFRQTRVADTQRVVEPALSASNAMDEAPIGPPAAALA